ncbi:MAG: 1,3-beta-galactosyl-N-acetylhexosamine phosphorylase, partial [Clostridia bacterium]|nr:1,3-beta-galactosyl-N-acetylhexosamine phosphorylase [Clostridia bacterium]
MGKGRITIPTDKDLFDMTKRLVEKWGADAVLDSTATELPDNADELVPKRYKMFFTAHEDDDFAYGHDEYMQNIALVTDRKVATGDILEIDLMKGLFDGQVRVNSENHKKYWQVFDRTTGEEWDKWEYLGNNIVRIYDAEKYHEYTVNFFGQNLWNTTHISNYFWNHWTCRKARDIDPVFPEAFEEILKQADRWIKQNPQVNVVRFTSFFYHFFILYYKDNFQKTFDWFNYAMTASPAMFEKFYKEYGYEIKLEDLVTAGSYANHFQVPSKAVRDYTDLVERFVTETMAKIIEKFHGAGIETIMFWGDSWIGAEPYGKYFSKMNLDGVVGVGNSGVSFRMISDIPDLKFREMRMQPYFFSVTLNDDEVACHTLKRNWVRGRRAVMRKPVDRLGFGGYLKLAAEFPKFCDKVEEVCNEFRDLYDIVSAFKPYSPVKLAVISYWGKEKSWMTNMMVQGVSYQQTAGVSEFTECLSGMPVDVEFVSFDEVKAGRLKEFDVALNAGLNGTSFSGGDCWKDEKLLSSVREFVAGGGGFIGIGEPTAVYHNGRFFQLADILGVE